MLKRWRWGEAAIPAIDLLDGRVVRLRRGRYDQATVHSHDPVGVAERLAAAGAVRLHVVDLDAARTGVRSSAHRRLVRRLAAVPGLRVQLGGGLRTAADVEAALAIGVDRVLVGTLAAESPEVVGALVRGTGRVAAAIDCAGGTVRVRGWTADSGADPVALLRRLAAAGVRDVLVTAIDRDGTGAGPDLDLVRRLRPEVPGELVCAGGVSSPDDVAAAVAAGADAVVVGRALYQDAGRLHDHSSMGMLMHPCPTAAG